MSDNLSPLSNRTSALLESWIWIEILQNYGLMEKPKPWLFLQSTFPQTGADIIAQLLEIPIIKLKLQ